MSDIPYYAGGVDRNLLRALAVLRCANQEKAMSDKKLRAALTTLLGNECCQMSGDIHYEKAIELTLKAIHQSGLKLVPADAVVVPKLLATVKTLVWNLREAKGVMGDYREPDSLEANWGEVIREATALLNEQREES